LAPRIMALVDEAGYPKERDTGFRV
jgi:hypothetical protein